MPKHISTGQRRENLVSPAALKQESANPNPLKRASADGGLFEPLKRQRGPAVVTGDVATNAAQASKADLPPRAAGLRQHTKFFEDGSTRTDFQRPGQIGNAAAQGTGVASTSGAAAEQRAQQAALATADLRGAVPHVRSDGGLATTDSHYHPTNYAQRGLTPKQTLAMMDELGVRNTVLMPIPTTIVSPKDDERREALGGHHCGPSYYVPPRFSHLTAETMTNAARAEITASSELVHDSAVDYSAAFRHRNSDLSDAEKSRFDPMITGVHLGGNFNTDSLLKKLYENKGVFTGIGEVTIHKELVEEMFAGTAQANLLTHVQPFKDLAGVAGAVGMPIVLHCDVDSLDNQAKRGNADYTPQHLEGLKKLFASEELKDTTMVWAHAGGLGRFVTEPDGHTNELQTMLDENPKLHVDISWSQVATQLTKPQAIERWAEMIEKNPDRFLIGSDSLAPSNPEAWAETFDLYKGLVDKLSPATREKLLNSNYERVFVESRANVRDFEKNVLTDDFYNSQLMAKEGPRTTAASIQQFKDANQIA